MLNRKPRTNRGKAHAHVTSTAFEITRHAYPEGGSRKQIDEVYDAAVYLVTELSAEIVETPPGDTEAYYAEL